MDRPVSKDYKRKIALRQGSLIVFAAVFLALVVIFLKTVFLPGVNLSRETVSQVEAGNIQTSVQGSGTVVPYYEEIISAPFRSSIIKIVRKPGDKVNQDDTLLILNNKLAINDLDMLRNESDLQNIRIEKLRIELQRLKDDYDFNKKIKDIRVENARLAYEAEAALLKIGGTPLYNVKKAKTEWDIEQLELQQEQFTFNNQVNERKNGIHEIETEINIQKNKIIRARDIVDKGYVRAPFKGDISWIIDQPGASVSEGQQIARLADFSTYKLKGTISNAWSGRIIAGQDVEIRNQGEILSGKIENILPAVSQGMMECTIKIESGNISALRPSQQLEIRVIMSLKENVLRIPNGPYYKDRGFKKMYVIRGKRAYKTNVLLGDANFDHVEVVEGLKAGDKIIITDIAEKYTRDKIRIRK